MQRAVLGTSTASENWIGLPMSNVSSRASSSLAARIFSAKRSSRRLRTAGDLPAQRPSSNAARALATAASMSGCAPRATWAMLAPSMGEMQSKAWPLAAARRWPSMTMRPSMRSAAARSRQVGVATLIRQPPCFALR